MDGGFTAEALIIKEDVYMKNCAKLAHVFRGKKLNEHLFAASKRY